MATTDSYGQTRVFVRDQGGSTGYVRNGVIAASGATGLVEAGGTLRVAANSTINIDGNLNLTSGTITMPGNLALGYLDLNPHLFSARNAASDETIASGSTAPTAFFGGLLMPDGTPKITFLSTANRLMSLQWASADVAAVVLPPVNIPADFSTAGGLTLQLYGETAGTASAADAIQAITITARFATITSATNANVGTTHANFTTTPSWKGITLASGDVATAPLTLTLTPQAHANRQINVYGMRASYTKLTS